MPVPLAVPQPFGCTSVPLLTLVMVYAVPLTGKPLLTCW